MSLNGTLIQRLAFHDFEERIRFDAIGDPNLGLTFRALASERALWINRALNQSDRESASSIVRRTACSDRATKGPHPAVLNHLMHF